MHVHVLSGNGEAKLWLEPEIDVDLIEESIEHPERFPLKSKII